MDQAKKDPFEKSPAWQPGACPAQAVEAALRDAGCSAARIRAFTACLEAGDTPGRRAILDRQRRELLAQLHKTERRIECLDYLDYQLRRSRK